MINLKIEGDYIDSFLYSGNFFLIDTEMQISSFSWNEILSKLNDNKLVNFFNGHRIIAKEIESLKGEYIIDKKTLDSCKNNNISFDYWITDIDIYRNTLFVSSHEGIKAIATERTDNRGNPEFKFLNHSHKITDEKVFDMSIGEIYSIGDIEGYARIIISCGNNGAYEIVTKGERGGIHKRSNESLLSPKTWIGCEFNSYTGLTILKNFTLREAFKFEGKHFKNDDNPNQKTDEDNSKLVTDIEDMLIEDTPKSINVNKLKQVIDYLDFWLVNDDLVVLNNNLKTERFKLEEFLINSDFQDDQNVVIDFVSEIDNCLTDVKQTKFGVILEKSESLTLKLKDKNEYVFSEYTNWRTFPKSKNYLNQMHVVQDDYISILGFNINQNKSLTYK